VGDAAQVDAWIAARVEGRDWLGHPPDDPDRAAQLLVITQSAARAALQAQGTETPDAERALAARLEAVAQRTGAAVAVVACYAAPDPPADPASEKRLDPVEGLLVRARVTRLDAAHTTAADLLEAMVPGRGSMSWSTGTVNDGPVVLVGSGGRATQRMTATVRDASGRGTERTYDAAREFISAQAWVEALLGDSSALLLIDAEAVEAGDTNPNLALDLASVAKTANVALGVLA
jgi:hypothetical protein